MRTKYLNTLRAVIATLAFSTLACSLFVNLAPTVVPTQEPLPLPTSIPAVIASPTNPPAPTVQNTPIPLTQAPEVTATDASSQVMADAKDYFQRGYLPFENGQVHVLDDFSKPGMSMDVFGLTNTHLQLQDFALWADIVLNTTGSTTYPNYTGCGFAYRVQNNSEGYTAILTNEAVRMGACNSGFKLCSLFGTEYGFGTGLVDVPNGSKTHFSLAVNKYHAWALLDGKLVGQYALYTTKLRGPGDLYYSTVSNINAGYHTACQISNVRVWESQP